MVLFQFSRILADESSGIGLGLALVSKRVRAYGDKLTLHAAPTGHTLFRFVWPEIWRGSENG